MLTQIKTFFLYLVYINQASKEYTMYLAAKNKGLRCTGMSSYMVQFEPGSEPQERPDKPMGYKKFYIKINKERETC